MITRFGLGCEIWRFKLAMVTFKETIWNKYKTVYAISNSLGMGKSVVFFRFYSYVNLLQSRSGSYNFSILNFPVNCVLEKVHRFLPAAKNRFLQSFNFIYPPFEMWQSLYFLKKCSLWKEPLEDVTSVY